MTNGHNVNDDEPIIYHIVADGAANDVYKHTVIARHKNLFMLNSLFCFPPIIVSWDRKKSSECSQEFLSYDFLSEATGQWTYDAMTVGR